MNCTFKCIITAFVTFLFTLIFINLLDKQVDSKKPIDRMVYVEETASVFGSSSSDVKTEKIYFDGKVYHVFTKGESIFVIQVK